MNVTAARNVRFNVGDVTKTAEEGFSSVSKEECAAQTNLENENTTASDRGSIPGGGRGFFL
jgi:hypothetical protein